MCSTCVCSMSKKLVDTIQLGIQLFNPHRFYPVLAGIHREGVVVDDFEKYLQSANVCFRNEANVKLVGVEPVVASLQLLTVCGVSCGETRKILQSSLMRLLTTEEAIVSAVIGAQKAGYTDSEFWDSIRTKIETTEFKGLSNTIRVLHLTTGHSLRGVEKFIEYMSETEIWRVLKYCKNLSKSEKSALTVAMESKISAKINTLTKLTDKLRYVDALLAVGSVHVEELVEAIGGPSMLSPSSLVDFCFMKKQVDEIIWRIDRDPRWLSGLKPKHVVKLLETTRFISDYTQTSKIVQACPIEKSITPFDLSELIVAFDKLNGNAWIEFPKVAKLIFEKFVLVLQECSQEEAAFLVSLLVHTVGIADKSLVNDLLKLAKLEWNDRYICETGKICEFVFSKFLRGYSNGGIDQILSELTEKNKISLQARLCDLSANNLLEVARLVVSNFEKTNDQKRLLNNLELVADAASVNTCNNIHTKLQLFELFALNRFPCIGLANGICENLALLNQLEFVDFVYNCSLVRCCPTGISEYISTHDMDGVLSTTQITNLIEAMSSLSVLDSNACRILVPIYFKSDNACSEYSAAILSSMLISLIVPSEHMLAKLLGSIDMNTTSDFDKEIIFGMKKFEPTLPEGIITQSGLPEGAQITHDNSTAVFKMTPSGFYFSDPTKYTSIAKFRMFIQQNSTPSKQIKIVNWL